MFYRVADDVYVPVLQWVGEQMPGESALIPPCTAAVRTPSPVGTAAHW